MNHNPWIQVWTGKKFHPLYPDPDEIDIEDIAHQLSMMCRFNGAVRFHYSVAQHSVYVGRRMWAKFNPDEYAKATGKTLTAAYAGMLGLLHDAPEAYIGDMVRPLKAEIPKFRKIESGIDNAVNCRFGLTKHDGSIYPLLVECDNVALATERRDVMNDNALSVQTASEWTLQEQPEIWNIDPWSIETAKRTFLETFESFSGGM